MANLNMLVQLVLTQQGSQFTKVDVPFTNYLVEIEMKINYCNRQYDFDLKLDEFKIEFF